MQHTPAALRRIQTRRAALGLAVMSLALCGLMAVFAARASVAEIDLESVFDPAGEHMPILAVRSRA
jgi:hypothetical protein